MAKSKPCEGNDLMLFVDGAFIKLATECTFNYDAVTSEGDTKDDAVNSISIDKFTMSASHSGQLLTTDAENALIIAKMKAKKKVLVLLGIASNASNEEVPEGGWTAPSTGMVSFYGFITSFSCTASSGSKATQGITITGVGELITPAAEQ